MGFEKKKRRNLKNIRAIELEKITQNCKNLLCVNTDHSYAAPIQSKSRRRKRSKPESETAGKVVTSTVESNKTANTKERIPSPNEKVETETEIISLKENTESLKQTEPNNSNVNTDNIDNQTNIESIFLKEEIVETLLEEAKENNKNIVITNTKQDGEDSSCLKTSENATNNINKGNLPEICILCATTNMSRKNYTLIIHFAEMIMDLSGVDILKSNISPIACSICFKYILEMWNFKQQIITADKFIKEKIPKQLGINLISTFGSRNVPKPIPFEYIDYNSTILNNSYKRRKEPLKEKKKVTNKLLSGGIVKSSRITKIDEVTLVPIEDILKEIDDAAESCIITPPKCTVCEKNHENGNLKKCDLKKKKEQDKFICAICGKQYLVQRSLKRHELIHKAKRYICDICKKAFHLKLYLIKHLRKHSAKKLFPCSYCSKRYSTKWNLSQHKRLHTNSLPYKCKLCSSAYRYNVTLKKHVRMSHTANEFL